MRYILAVIFTLITSQAFGAASITPAFGTISSADGGTVNAGKSGTNTVQIVGATVGKVGGKPTITIDSADLRPGAIGVDDAIAINAAIQSINRVVLRGSFHIQTPIIYRSGVTIEGLAPLNGATKIYTSVNGDYSIKAEGTLGIEGPLVTNIALRNIALIREGTNSTKGIKLAAVANAVIEGVKVYGMNGGPSLQLEQVWDSWFDKGYIHSSSYTGPATVIHMGLDAALDTSSHHGDSSNNLRFNGWTWESNTSTAIDFYAGSGANNIYNIGFNDCKIEHAGGNLDPLITVSNGYLNAVKWNGGMLATPNDQRLMFDMASSGAYIKDFTVSNIYMLAGSGDGHPGMFRFYNSAGLAFENNRVYASGGFATAPVIVNSSVNNYYSLGGTVNEQAGADMFSSPPAQSPTFSSKLKLVRKLSGVTGFLEFYPYDATGTAQIATQDGNIVSIAGGKVGIGKTPDTYAFEVNGSIQAQGRGVSVLKNAGTGGDSVFWASNTHAPTDQKQWDVFQNDDTWQVRPQSDDYASANPAFGFSRSGATPTGFKVYVGGSANKTICWKADGKTLGYCSDAPNETGTCTCN